MAQGSLVRLTFLQVKMRKSGINRHRLYRKAWLKGFNRAEAKEESSLQWQSSRGGIWQSEASCQGWSGADWAVSNLGCGGRSCRGGKPQHPSIKFTQILTTKPYVQYQKNAECALWTENADLSDFQWIIFFLLVFNKLLWLCSWNAAYSSSLRPDF